MMVLFHPVNGSYTFEARLFQHIVDHTILSGTTPGEEYPIIILLTGLELGNDCLQLLCTEQNIPGCLSYSIRHIKV